MIRRMISLVIVPVFFLLASCAANTTPVGPEDMNGTWTSEKNDSGSQFAATITDNHIEMNLESPDMSALYWVGTFQVPENTGNDFVILSDADREALDGSILGSQDDTKEFSYSNGKLIFKFQAMGVAKMVTLNKTS